MKNKCTYPYCNCKTESVVVDNLADLMCPHSHSNYEQSVVIKVDCKHNKPNQKNGKWYDVPTVSE